MALTNKSGNELQVCASAQVMIILFPTRIPYMVIAYIHIWYFLIVSHILTNEIQAYHNLPIYK